MEFYHLQHKLKKPSAIILIVIICCFVFAFHLLNSDPTATSHIGKLTRRGQPEFDHDTHVKSLGRQPSSQTPDQTYYAFEARSEKQNQDKETLVREIKDLQLRIEDLKKIKLSVRNELLSMQRERTKFFREKSSLIARNDKILAQISKYKNILKQYELDVSANKKLFIEQSCYDDQRLVPIVFNPLKSIDIKNYSADIDTSTRNVAIPAAATDLLVRAGSFENFDYSLCPLTRQFKFALVDTSRKDIDQGSQNRRRFLLEILKEDPRYTKNIQEACLVIIVDILNPAIPETHHRNTLVIDITDSVADGTKIQVRNTVVAASQFGSSPFRHNFDLVLPSVWVDPDEFTTITGSMPPHSPIKRKYLAAYFGPSLLELGNKNALRATLQAIHRGSISDQFLFVYNCSSTTSPQCFNERPRMLEMANFLIIATPDRYFAHSTTSEEIYLALSKGTIPVILGDIDLQLPFDEVIDWRRAAIILPRARLSEIHFILRSYRAADLYDLKYHGKRIFENHLATSKQVLYTMIGLISTKRFQYPPPAIQNIPTQQHYQNNMLIDSNCTTNICIDSKSDLVTNLISNEILGPRERPFKSPAYLRNFSLILNSHYELWNSHMQNPFRLFPSQPRDPVSPSEYKFLSQDNGFRPIGDGSGGSGNEFARAIGGDYPNEQFTIVLLTYEREALLMKTLERLKGMAFLNKILVIWNGINHPPSDKTVWPDVGVPVVVVKPVKNSLNNRFVPYDSIETDAIFTMDDDSPLRPDEIVFAFRVWRQSRDRIVGFPGRYHAWDGEQKSWVYNSNHSCELSMVLTGGAFFHRYYSYMYSFTMPEVIRSIVDKFMNCEDIALNFLVAHMTRQPPIKVTSRWTFHCPSCLSSLSEEDSHFRERHECLNMFASIYGYMPLLSTQHRSDSILFKTRLPHDKQKCFKFV